LELYEKIYVSPDFLETEHGQLPCESCHGGDPRESDWQAAHRGVVKDPSFPDSSASCGQCHEDICASAHQSLHYTLAPFERVLAQRMGDTDKARQAELTAAREKHCGQCHASCGQCHVSRPNYVRGGLLAKHLFQKPPPMEVTCAACHGGRVFGEYTGLNEDYPPDVHFEQEEMTCMDCHSADEIHADAGDASTRFEVAQLPSCLQCHPDVTDETTPIEAHRLHGRKLACQVCHAQANKNCFTCHVGTDKKGLPYFKCKRTEMSFKIGLNPMQSETRPYDYVVLQHPPTHLGVFDFYVKDALSRFDSLPTWKLDAPHNIRRITARNESCNNCHGNRELFLGTADMAPEERAANSAVIVPEDRLPAKIERQRN
jgi:thiosulfate/3-mercaptopyruvate sulfurtransferase